MAGSIAKAYVQVIPSADGIKGKLTNAFSGEGSSAGNAFGSNLIGKVKNLIVAAGIGKAFSDALMAGSDLQQLKGGVQKIFDEMDTSKIMADAANAYKDLNMSANQYLATINDVGAAFSATMGDEKGYSVARTGLQAISDYATGTGKNVDELSQKFTMITRSTSSYQSIADQFSGILPATSAGFLEQAQAAGFLSSEYKKLTDVPIDEYQQAVSEMLEKGTADLGLAGNTAAETATTFAGSMAAMKSAYSNFLGALATGENIGPSLEVLGETVFTFISGNLLPMVGNVLTELPTVLNSAFSMAIKGLNLVAGNAESIVQSGIDLVTSIGSSIITAIPYLAEAGVNIVTALGSAIINTDWVQLGTDTITALKSSLDLAAGEILGTDGNIVQSVLDGISTNLPSVLESGVNIVSEVVNGILEGIPNLLDMAGNLMNQLVDTILTVLPDMLASGVALIGQLATGLISNLPSVITSAVNILAELVANIASHLPELLAQGIALIGELAAGLIKAIPDLLAAIPKVISSIFDAFGKIDWLQLGKDIISGLINGIGAMAGALWNAVTNIARSALSAIKKFFGIASPSKVMRDQVGKFIPAGLAVGIEANTKPLTDAMHDLSDLTTDTMQSDLRISNSAPSVSGSGRVYGDSHYTFYVYAAEGQDEEEIAERVMQKIQHEVEKKEAGIA